MGRPVPPGQLTPAERDRLLAARARGLAAGRHTELRALLVQHRAAGTPVAALAAACGLSQERVRQLSRHPPPAGADDGPGAGQLLERAGWLPTRVAAEQLGVPDSRLRGQAAAGRRDGVAADLGWTTHWHGASLPGWWAGLGPTTLTPAEQAAAARRHAWTRARRSGHTLAGAAHAAGVSLGTSYRWRRQLEPRTCTPSPTGSTS